MWILKRYLHVLHLLVMYITCKFYSKVWPSEKFMTAFLVTSLVVRVLSYAATSITVGFVVRIFHILKVNSEECIFHLERTKSCGAMEQLFQWCVFVGLVV